MSIDTTAAPETDETVEDDEPQPLFSTLTAWLHEWFLAVWQHKRDQSQVWCPQWWQHAEAIARLEAMWRSWESLRLDGPVGMATWWRDIADYQMSQLLDGSGPFAACRSGHTDDPSLQLSSTSPPQGWFDPDSGATDESGDWS